MIQFSKGDVDCNLALSAFRNTSHTPEKRAAGVIREYTDHMAGLAQEFAGYATDDNRSDIQTDLERYRQGYVERLTAWLHSHGNVASAFIVGPTRFPTERNRKRSDAADKKRAALWEYQNKVLKKLRQKYNPQLIATAPVRSDDPEAIEKLTAKLASLEALQTAMKAANRIIRSKKLTDEEKVTKLVDDLGFDEVNARKLLVPDDLTGRAGFAPFQLSNNSAEIRRLKQRIEELQRAQEAAPVEDQDHGAFLVRESKDLGKLQIIFPGKPDKEVRYKLNKQFGFNWSGKNKAWQRLLNDNARRAAELFAEDYNNS